MAEQSPANDKRQVAALAAIRRAYGTEDDADGATLFVSHHLEEIGDAYWKDRLGKARPEPQQVLDLLVLRDCYAEDDEGMIKDTFEFTLPGEVTDYVICVRFSEGGEVEGIEMES